MTDAGFMAAGLDRADAVRSDPDALAALSSSLGARLLRLDGLAPRIAADGGLDWGSLAEADGNLALLGVDEAGRGRFVALNGASSTLADRQLWSVLEALPERDAAIYAAARSLVDWHARHGHCARCGSATDVIKAGWARRCGGCRAEHFPRVDPVVIMLAEHDGEVLLGRQPGWPDRRYSALAGFVEPGETLEGAVVRELEEEAGVRARAVRYVASQPWPFPSSLMIGAFARVDDPALRIDTTELEDAFWCDAAGVHAALAGDPGAPFQAPPPIAIARLLLERWLGERAE